MGYLAQCAPERITMTLVEGAVEDEAERLEALAALAEVSLLKHDPFEDGTPAVTVHRLVQAVARARSKANTSKIVERLTQRLAEVFPEDAYHRPDVWAECAKLLPHSKVIRKHIDGERLADTATLLDRTADYLFGRGDYTEAEDFWREAIQVGERGYGPQHPKFAALLNNLALLLRSTSQYPEAEKLFREAIQTMENSAGRENREVALMLGDLADLFTANEPIRRGRTRCPRGAWNW